MSHIPPQLALFLFLDSELGEEFKNTIRESDAKKAKSLVEKVYLTFRTSGFLLGWCGLAEDGS